MGFGDYIVEQMLGVLFIAFQIVISVVRGIIGSLTRKDEWNVEEEQGQEA